MSAQHSPACIALIGPSGAGKSTVGRMLARRLGWHFVDLDELISEMAGLPTAAIFEHEGEAGFRERESLALAQALQQSPLVLACGGGVVIRQSNRDLLRARSWCVYLTAAIETLADRVTADTAASRPLLAQSPAERLMVLVGERRPLYAGLARWTIHTDQLETGAVVADIVRAWERSQGALGVPTGQVSVHGGAYAVKFGSLDNLGVEARQLGMAGAAWIISDDQVGPRYADRVRAALDAAGIANDLCLVPAGEPSKSLAQAGLLYDWLLGGGVQRSDWVIALGGGVVGDLAGFAAATVLRGVPVVQVPTTILAMIDSSIGGKTGVNHQRGKNLIGAFHQPRLVFADADVLKTLPARERSAGWAEAAKHGVIADAGLFEELERHAAGLDALSREELELLLARAAAVKIGVVNRDERETGERMLLNYGHTLGQAVEAATGYKRYLHGEAVAIGMTFAGELAARLGRWSGAEQERQTALLHALDLPTALPADLDPEATLAALNLDKKRAAGRVRWVLPSAIGSAQVVDDVPPALVRELLGEWLAGR
ncbi:MAG TPA: 3-dehydroquinate synthase [Herpetosiphonaceae bacterium]